MNYHHKFTIFVPTLNRPLFINRLLKYYKLTKFNGYIVIGDSSNEIELKKNRQVISNYKQSLKVKHFEYASSVPFGEVLYDLVNNIETEFAGYLADDDIIVTSSINPCIDYLLQNKEFSGVNGRSLIYSTEEDLIFGKINNIKNYKLANLEKNFGSERLKEFFENIYNLNMSIQRTSNLLDSYKELTKLTHKHSKFIFDELIHATITSIRGKVKQLDKLFLIRQAHSTQYYHQAYKNFFEWFIDDYWEKSYFILEDLAISELQKSDIKDYDISRQYFRNLFFKYYKNMLVDYHTKEILNKPKKKFRLSSKNFVISKIKKIKFYKFIKIIYTKLFRDNNSDLLDSLLNKSSRDYEDLLLFTKTLEKN
tara:strand:+ start:1423 stop:2520 length:1098 start_codon:yes stop_codon:yes gene_type:complete